MRTFCGYSAATIFRELLKLFPIAAESPADLEAVIDVDEIGLFNGFAADPSPCGIRRKRARPCELSSPARTNCSHARSRPLSRRALWNHRPARARPRRRIQRRLKKRGRDTGLDGNLVHFHINAGVPGQDIHGLLFSGGIDQPHEQQDVTFVHLLLQILGIALMGSWRPAPRRFPLQRYRRSRRAMRRRAPVKKRPRHP